MWVRSFENFANLQNISEENKLGWMLHYAGPKVMRVFDNLSDDSLDENISFGPLAGGYVKAVRSTYENGVHKLNNFYAPKRSNTYERHIFRQLKQKTDERIDVYVMRLRCQAERCNFGCEEETNMKDQLTEGCNSSETRRKILSKDDKSLAEIIKMIRIDETVSIQHKYFVKDQSKGPDGDVCQIDNQSKRRPRKLFSNTNFNIECNRCGFTGHKAADLKCPARNTECMKCQKIGHFARKCFTKTENYKRKYQPDEKKPTEDFIKKKIKSDDTTVNMVEQAELKSNTTSDTNSLFQSNNEDYDDVFCLDSVDDGNNELLCNLGGIEIKLIVDSGSKYNLLDRETWTDLKALNINTISRKKECDRRFKAYGGKELPILGVFEACIEIMGKKTVAEFYVVNGPGKFLLGRDTAIQLNVLKIGYDVNQVDEIQPLGKIKDIVIDIPLKQNVKPVIQPYRRIPAPLEKLVDRKINDLLQREIIEPVEGASKWISPLVVVPKDDDEIRLCVDMRRANAAIERENHPLPIFEDFLPNMGNAKYFSKIDVEQAFHQVMDAMN